MGSATNSVALFVFAASSCVGASSPFTEEQQIANRDDFPVLVETALYVGAFSVLRNCEPELEVSEAYAGIDPAADWYDIGFLRIDAISWSTPGAPAATEMIVLDEDLFDQDDFVSDSDSFFGLAPYSGPTGDALDARITCGDEIVSPENTLRRVRRGSTGGFQSRYGLTPEDVLVALDEEFATNPSAGTFTATQESLVVPFGVTEAVVGPVAWPPPALPSFQEL